MRPISAAVVFLFLMPYATPGRAQDSPPDGPLTRAVHEEARRLSPCPDTFAIQTQTPRRRESLIGAVIGAAGGLVLGYVSAVHLANKQCHGSCGDEKALMALSLVGLPIAGGLLGYHAGRQTTQEVIYREPGVCVSTRRMWTRAVIAP